MSLDQMWEQLAAHQPLADQRGYGTAWRQMGEERTTAVCDAVFRALWNDSRDKKSMQIGYAAYAAWTAGVVLKSLKGVQTHLERAEQ
jgi:hypothetical protein